MPIRIDGSGTITGISAGGLPDGSITASNLASGAARTNYGAGGILQVIQTLKTDANAGTFGTTGWITVPSFSASITPSAASNKVLVIVDLKAASPVNSIFRARLLRGATVINQGDAASNRPRGFAQIYNGAGANIDLYSMFPVSSYFLDSPATTSSVTYSVEIGGDGSGVSYRINMTHGDRDNTVYDTRATSTITLMEIAA